jgi:hypothetical protein
MCDDVESRGGTGGGAKQARTDRRNAIFYVYLNHKASVLALVFMAHASAGGAASEAVGLQRCDRSKITIIETTEAKEGGFGKCQIAKPT